MYIEPNKEFYTVYKITNNLDGKIYVGYHATDDLDDNYFGSGKHLNRAVAKYGQENFTFEYIKIFDNHEDAENLEAEIVNREFVERDDTYNISLGGNICVLYGKDNGFYGREHSDETKSMISKIHTGNTWYSDFMKMQVIDNTTGEVFDNKQRWKRANGAGTAGDTTFLDAIGSGKIRFVDDERQVEYQKRFDDREIKYALGKKTLSDNARERFTGVKRTPDSIAKTTEGLRKWREENPELHYEKMMRLNTNPEKIEKMAAKHRGMKRSPEACKNISNSLLGNIPSNKGKKMIYEILTKNTSSILKGEPLPEGWAFGYPEKKYTFRGCCYNDGSKNKFFKDPDNIPDGWTIGRAPKNKKNKE